MIMGNKLCCLRTEESSSFDYLVKRTILIVTEEDANDRMETSLPMIQLLQRLNTDEEAFWQLGESMIRLAPADEVYAVSIITLLLSQCCLPSPSLLVSCAERFKLSSLLDSHGSQTRSMVNVCLLLGCLAYRYAGQRSILLLQDDVFNFLLRCLQLNSVDNSAIILAALYALERFCLTRENRLRIEKELARLQEKNPLLTLQALCKSQRLKQHKISFVATWMLDNIFNFDDYIPTYKRTSVENLNVNLNLGDISSALMLSPTGLEVRSNVGPFETVRSSVSVREGAWYYEVSLVTDGVLQIGWMSTTSEIDPEQGSGVGDDLQSVGFDGCRQYIWYRGEHTKHRFRWKAGDTVGTLIDFRETHVVFSLNGRSLPPFKAIFRNLGNASVVAAASLMTFQQCVFNFGRTPFKYPPSVPFKNMNDHGCLLESRKLVLPRSLHRIAEEGRVSESYSNPCFICLSQEADAQLRPCGHDGLCKACARQISTCPFCRQFTEKLVTLKKRNSKSTPRNSIIEGSSSLYPDCSEASNRTVYRSSSLPEDSDEKTDGSNFQEQYYVI